MTRRIANRAYDDDEQRYGTPRKRSAARVKKLDAGYPLKDPTTGVVTVRPAKTVRTPQLQDRAHQTRKLEEEL